MFTTAPKKKSSGLSTRAGLSTCVSTPTTARITTEYAEFEAEGFDLTKAETYEKFVLSVTDTKEQSNFIINPSQTGVAPQAIIIAGKWAWPTERTSIGDAYPEFKKWVKDTSADTWYTAPAAGKVVSVE